MVRSSVPAVLLPHVLQQDDGGLATQTPACSTVSSPLIEGQTFYRQDGGVTAFRRSGDGQEENIISEMDVRHRTKDGQMCFRNKNM